MHETCNNNIIHVGGYGLGSADRSCKVIRRRRGRRDVQTVPAPVAEAAMAAVSREAPDLSLAPGSGCLRSTPGV